jgi:hypothetical protein
LLKRFAIAAVALLAFGGPLAVGRAQAGDTTADLTAMTNADRAAGGLRALATAADLQSLAQSRANDMARSGKLAHTTSLGSKVSNWKKLGENVGRGPNLRDIETAFMASPSHRENIVDPDFSQLGVGVTFDGKEYFYVAVVFRQPQTGAGASPSTTARPVTPPTTRAAATPPKPKPTTTTLAPTTTTTQPPTTTTTAPPPPSPPVEEIAVAPVDPPPAPETTTTTAPRPIFASPDFLAANFSDVIVPASATMPIPVRHRSPLVIVFAAALGVAVGAACTATALRRPALLRIGGQPGTGPSA